MFPLCTVVYSKSTWSVVPGSFHGCALLEEPSRGCWSALLCTVDICAELGATWLVDAVTY